VGNFFVGLLPADPVVVIVLDEETSGSLKETGTVGGRKIWNLFSFSFYLEIWDSESLAQSI
jgi:hypothetical protein